MAGSPGCGVGVVWLRGHPVSDKNNLKTLHTFFSSFLLSIWYWYLPRPLLVIGIISIRGGGVNNIWSVIWWNSVQHWAMILILYMLKQRRESKVECRMRGGRDWYLVRLAEEERDKRTLIFHFLFLISKPSIGTFRYGLLRYYYQPFLNPVSHTLFTHVSHQGVVYTFLYCLCLLCSGKYLIFVP